jgi:hypothetical protein
MGKFTKTSEVAKDPEDRRLHCNQCLRDTNHGVLYSRAEKWAEEFEDGFAIDGSDTYSLVLCRGCDSIRMVHEHWFSEDWDDEGPVQYRSYYPPNVIRSAPEWLAEGLPAKSRELRELIGEIYKAVAVSAFRIAAMGIRALVERVMIDKVDDQGSFEKNIPKFFEAGFVAGHQQKMFRDILIEAGHAAMHRPWEPSSEDINTLLDIVEAMIKAIYVVPAKAGKVAKSIPPRAPKGGKGGEPGLQM